MKKGLAFTNNMVFGTKFKSTIGPCYCMVSKLIFEEKINIDGSINLEKVGLFLKDELWSYIYYLYYYNNEFIDEFKDMKLRGKASAANFYKVVKGSQYDSSAPASLNVTTMVGYINEIIHKYNDDLFNPIIGFLDKILKTRTISKVSSIKVNIGDHKFENIKNLIDIKEKLNSNSK